MADKDESAKVGRIVMPPIALCARRGRQKADFFVIADGWDFYFAADRGDADRDTLASHFCLIL
jgi:hypothetical protein